MLKAHLGHLLPGPGPGRFSLLLALENDARQQDLRLECWSLQSLTSNRAGALVQVPTRHTYLELEDTESCVHTPETAHSTLVILGFGGLRESCDIMVMVCMGKERKPTAEHGESQRLQTDERGGSPSTEGCSGDVPHARDCLWMSLHTFTLPASWLPNAVLALGVQAPGISLLC